MLKARTTPSHTKCSTSLPALVSDSYENFSLMVNATQVSGDGNSACGVVYAYRDGHNYCELDEEGNLALQGDIDDNHRSWFENSLP